MDKEKMCVSDLIRKESLAVMEVRGRIESLYIALQASTCLILLPILRHQTPSYDPQTTA